MVRLADGPLDPPSRLRSAKHLRMTAEQWATPPPRTSAEWIPAFAGMTVEASPAARRLGIPGQAGDDGEGGIEAGPRPFYSAAAFALAT